MGQNLSLFCALSIKLDKRLAVLILLPEFISFRNALHTYIVSGK